ncbi:unnamed protein product [Darwinula stevensoni]|uniref:Uncharacterized protein n=1 Tax=Darwinula stevensoni TaxID=69355 RepID=A0A7R9AB83_9CRUS|nr:unnamed protein product [Darwinula stevensoni]CAG0899161.1 unnamed protein product [Darwinula stevensoni]
MGALAGVTWLFLFAFLRWPRVEGECNSTLNGSGYIYSPNYPDNYNNDDYCWYRIEVPEEGYTSIDFRDFDLEWSTTCQFDSLAIAKYSNRQTEVRCGRFDYLYEGSETSFYEINFKTDGSVTSKGFFAEVLTMMPLKCDKGWTEFQLGCYRFVDERKTALEAQSACEDVGADLASIHGDKEFQFIWEHASSSPLWIGLRAQDSRRKWIDGTSYDYKISNLDFSPDDGFAYIWTDEWVKENCASTKQGPPRERKDCVYASLHSKGGLPDEVRFPFVCKKDRPTTIFKGD